MDSDLSKNIPKARWLHIIPPVLLVYIIAYMDRTNISFAMAGGMNKTLGIAADMSGLAAGIFFVGYMVLQIPGGQIAERGNVKKFIALTIVGWGGFAILSGFVQNSIQLLIVRFLIGVAEGGVYPAMLTILSHWFPNEERGRANALFCMNLPIGAIITGPLSGLIISAFSWRYVFIIEGIIALALIFVWWPLISDRPENAKWISNEEKNYILTKLREEQEEFKKEDKVNGKVPFKKLLSNSNVWKLTAIYFCFTTGVYGFALWLPSLLKEIVHFGMSGIGFLSIIPYIGTIIGLYVFSSLSDKSNNRRFWTGILLVVFAVCLILSVQFKHVVWLSFIFMIGCGACLQAPASVFWTIPPILFESDMAASSRGFINALGNLGGFLGPYIVGFLISRYNSTIGIFSLAIFLLVGFFISMTLPAKTAGAGYERN
ncbi:MFS transporter [Clostridium sp. HV4-5-A1G]|jgi:sugar phosphate permease|uniref:MFS transporter n=1 Tax=Clostridium sp. HV4-5-A1G TaxID=2004595 RepID=UPI00123C1E97|nr:MFS transporter [Clostridium sp. HV4-5-A1G]KAA8674090.1 MFS transporter [Clostridium sp. HV4-5-A1G]CAB1253664.1 Putative tartrate transporter [Clostridiaceae bacterium BL-3]